MDETTGSLYDQRLKRTMDAVQCKVPDRVPTLVDFGYYAAKHGGISVEDAFYDSAKWATAYKQTVLDFQPDVFYGLSFFSGAAYGAIGTRVVKWPGHGVSPDQSMQVAETELMMAEEYDDLLDDPSDFIVRKVLSRCATNLKGLEYLPQLTMFGGLVSGFIPLGLTHPDLMTAIRALHTAGTSCMEWFIDSRMAFIGEMEASGFPAVYQACIDGNAFEMISSQLRGMRGAMLDMYRQPEKLLEAIDRLSRISLKQAAVFKPMGRNTFCWSAALKGADGFMSRDQFETFYWPYLKKTLTVAVNNGYTPCMLWEGDFTSRLGYIQELPEGKIIHRFDKTDIFKAKEILGGRHCIAGGISASLLKTGTVDDVKERCKKLIDVAGKEGGYIMSHSCQMDDLKPENLKAMIDFTRDYGVYR